MRKKISVKEFRQLGFLQEVNRCFLHPLGLALEVAVNEETGEERLTGVWDCREDPEGIFFSKEELLERGDEMRCKADLVAQFRDSKIEARARCWGVGIAEDNSIIQPSLSGTTIQSLRWAPPSEGDTNDY